MYKETSIKRMVEASALNPNNFYSKGLEEKITSILRYT